MKQLKQRKKRRKRPQDKKFEKEPVKIVIAPFGIFAYHKGKIVKKEIWKLNKCAERYLTREESIKRFITSIPIRAKYEKGIIFGQESEKLAKKFGIKFNFQKFMIDLTKLKIKYGFSKDKLVIQSSNMIDEINKMINLFYERLGEWYGFYWPEIVEKINSIEDFLKIVGKKKTEQSMGFDLDEKDLKMIEVAGDELKSLLSFKNKLTRYIEELMGTIAPNTSKIAGPLIGAKLISIAGSLKKLVEMPSSTIQVLGAEKALFRHIRKGAKPPKYGILLSHELMHKINQKNRGKLARLLASKISIAAKVDFYSKGKDIVWKEMLNEINKKIEKF